MSDFQLQKMFGKVVALVYLTVSAAAGTVQVLNYNNLGAENNGTAALFVYDKLNHKDAETSCSSYGESLLPVPRLSSAVNELRYQLDYLVSTGALGSDDLVWVKGSACSTECLAYVRKLNKTKAVSCKSTLPSLCSSSVPPTTDQHTVKSSKITVDSEGYKFTGYRDKRSFRFLGIPFADPPVKDLRFMPPQPYNGSKDIDATKLGASCMQAASAYGETSNNSEDCLFLNVFTPVRTTDHSVKKPVAVYFYGGAFVEGASSLIDYDGGNFASRNDIITVTVNYRLGALGFLATEKLLDGSLGIRDQIQALRWVKEHISSFGGDADNVSIFGQSAGGQSTVALLSSSSAKGLFHKAIAQSAPVDLPWYTRDVYTKIVTPAVANAVGCAAKLSEADLAKCLQSKPATAFVDNYPAFSTAQDAIVAAVASGYLHTSTVIAAIEPFLPIVDDKNTGVIDDQFDVLLKKKSLPNRVPVIFSTVSQEATLFVNAVLSSSIGSSQALLDTTFSIVFPAGLAAKIVASGAFKTDKSDPDSVRNSIGAAVTESEWTCAQAYVLDNGGTDLFPAVYQFDVRHGHQQTNVNVTDTCLPNSNFNATCHTADVLPVWGNLNSKTKGVAPYYDNNDVLHSQMLNDIWSAFFRTGNPNPDTATLKARGPAYESTYNIFAADKYKISRYAKGAKDVTLLDFPPATSPNPGLSKRCAVFTDYGYTFQNAKLGI